MKIGILADTHLGENKFKKMSNYQNCYCSLNYKIFEEAIDTFIKDKVECVAIAGDLFDSPNPDILAASIALKNFKKLKDNNIKIIIISGNHDYSQRLEASNNHCFDIFDNICYVTEVNDISSILINDCNFILCPYKSINKNDSYEKIFNRISKDNNIRNIIMIHGFVDYNNENNDDSNELYSFNKKFLEMNDENIDLMICGHIHIKNLIKYTRNKHLVRILTPGSLMPAGSNIKNTEFKSSIWIYNSENNVLKEKTLKNSVSIYNIILDNKESLNNYLNDISSDKNAYKNFYFLTYIPEDENSNLNEDLDLGNYKNALSSSLYLNIEEINSNITLKDDEEILLQKEDDMKFWTWLNNNYKDYYNIFKQDLESNLGG